MVALRTLFQTYLAPGVMRTNRRYDNKDSVHLIIKYFAGSVEYCSFDFPGFNQQTKSNVF
jgi:hypothetical protein